VIFNRLKGRQTAITCTKKGRLPALAMNVENDIEKCLIARAQMVQPCDKAELKELVREYVVIHNISTPFTNNTPGAITIEPVLFIYEASPKPEF